MARLPENEPVTTSTNEADVHHLALVRTWDEALEMQSRQVSLALCGVVRQHHPNPLQLPPCETCHALALHAGCLCEEVAS